MNARAVIAKKKILIALGVIFIIVSPAPINWEPDRIQELNLHLLLMFIILSAGFLCIFTAKESN
ncbi:MAG TPA: hypothetical protein PK886_00965 [Candidatus Paceibacterota bacterium]|nr:hypothetical protein [Candidatus Paceibacterota bacterium]